MSEKDEHSNIAINKQQNKVCTQKIINIKNFNLRKILNINKNKLFVS